MPKYTLLFLLCSGLTFTAHAQLPQYQAQVFGEEFGIGGGQIFDGFTDLDGFIWITTATTLQRFDGRKTRKFLFGENITYAMCTSEGRIWVLSGQSLWRNRSDWRDFEKVPFDTTGGLWLRGIFEMENKGFFVLTNKGLYLQDTGSALFSAWNTAIPTPSGRHNIARLDTCVNTLFYTVKDSICALDMESGTARMLPFKPEYMHLMAVTPDLAVLTDYRGKSYWFDFKKNEVRYMDAQQYHFERGLHDLFVYGWAPIDANRFLVSTKFGLCEYDLTHDEFALQSIFEGGVPIDKENELQRIFRDKTGVFWAITRTSLLAIKPLINAFGLLRNYHFSAPEQWDNRVFGLVEDHAGNIWMGGPNGFKRMDGRNGKVRAYKPVEDAKDQLSSYYIRSIATDGNKIILGPTYSGVWLFDPLTERYSRPHFANGSVRKSITTDYIDHIGALRDGNYIICGRQHPYILRTNRNAALGPKATTYDLDFISFSGDNANMNVVFEDSKGRIWLGSNNGIHCLNAEYQLLFEVKTDFVSSIFEETPDVFLISTVKGLRRIKITPGATGSGNVPSIETIYTPVEGVGIVSLFRDRLQRYWLGTLSGLYLADPQLTTFRKFDFFDNIQSQVFSPASTIRARNGMVFTGGQNGLNYFIPENISFEDNTLTAGIQSLRLNDSDSVLYQPGGTLMLPYQMNTLTFEVVAPYFNNANKVRYRYRLPGYTKDWVETDGSLFRLANLPAGEYRLEVAASVTGKLWYPAKNFLVINILPPFWQTWWFRSLVIAGLLGLLYFFIRYRENRVRRSEERQLEMEKLRSTTLQYELETEQVVNYFNQSISGKSTIDDVLWDVTHQCIARLGWEDCVIYLLNPQRQVLVQKSAWGKKSSSDQQIVSPIEIPLHQGIVGSVAATGRAELISDTAADPRYIVDDATRGSELAAPIMIDGRVIGVIDSEHSQVGFYTPWHLQILTAIAALCGNKIALTEAEEAREETRKQLDEKEKNLLEIEKHIAQIRLIALTNHLNPHFLFNSLTSLNSLIFENQQLASDFLKHLSKVYRYLLQHKEKETVSLENEIEFVENYIFLLKTRFEDDIIIDIIVPKNALEKGIVPITLQILIENAVKHNVISTLRPLVIKVETSSDTLTVTNNIQRKKQLETSNRQGLESLRALYKHLSDQPLNVAETETHFIVTLPLIDR